VTAGTIFPEGGGAVRVRIIWLVIGTLVVLAGCTQVTVSNYPAKTQDEEQIVQVFNRIAGGVKSQSPNLIMQAYADDVYVGNFNKWVGVSKERENTSLNKAGLRQVYVKLFRATSVKEMSMEITRFQVTVTGDRASATGRTEIRFKLEAARKEAREDTILNDVLWRLKRGPGGWKIVEEIYQ
jgi:ketosteroid isomerase-like protein